MRLKKHVYDPITGDYLPDKNTLRDIKRYWAGFRAWPITSKLFSLAAILRLVQLGYAAFWYDEGVTAVLSRLSWANMLAATAADVHPPGYYIIIWLLAKVLPITEFTARLPSLLFSMITVYLALILAKKMDLSKQGQIVVLAWVAISPLQLHYAQEARMYSLLQLLVLLAVILVIDRKKALLSVVMAAILYTHNYGVFYLPALALAALAHEIETGYRMAGLTWVGHNWYRWKWPQRIRVLKKLTKHYYWILKPWLLWFILPVLLWLPWLATLLKQMGSISGGYWIQPVTIPSLVFIFYQLLFAYSMPKTFQALAVLLTCGVILYTAWRVYKDRPSHYKYLLTIILTPLVLAVIGSIIWRPLLLFRGLIGTAIPLVILIVKAIEGIRLPYKRYYAYLLIAVTLVAGLAGHYLYNAESKGETTTWVHEIENDFRNGDVIVSLNDNGIIAVMTYGNNMPLYKLTSCGAEPLGSLSIGTRRALGVKEISIDDLISQLYLYKPTASYSRVWFISTVAPVSPACEIANADEIINNDRYNVILIKELANTEYTQAGVYLITSKEIY